MLCNRPADKPADSGESSLAAGKVAYLQRRTATTINYVRNISKLLGGLNSHDKVISHKYKKTKASLVLFKNTIVALLQKLLPQFIIHNKLVSKKL